jgi:hypothetical protein
MVLATERCHTCRSEAVLNTFHTFLNLFFFLIIYQITLLSLLTFNNYQITTSK